MSLYDHIHKSRHLLKLCGDISIKPDIKPKKIKKAIKSYAPGNIESDQVLILIDNTVFGSGKQGMMLTEDMLFAFSNISGKYSIKVKDLESVSPQLRKALGVVPQIGLVLNGGYFVSLPGMVEDRDKIRDYLEWGGVLVGSELSPAIVLFSLFLHKALGCELILEKESDPGPPPWYIDESGGSE